MHLVRRGDTGAFETVYDRHAGAAFSLAHRICRERALAEDVVQEGFLALWRNGSRYDSSRGSLRSWLLRIVHNRAIDALRRGAARDALHGDDDGIMERLVSPVFTDVELIQRDEAREVRLALERLPLDQRRVIELAYFRGLTHVEIASILGAPVGTIKGRMRLGLAKMRIALGGAAEVFQ
jgi:RNA polymerase sigma-70 factor, ECF subfamily